MSEHPGNPDLFDRLARRALGQDPLARPRLLPRFAPLPALAASANLEDWLDLPEVEIRAHAQATVPETPKAATEVDPQEPPEQDSQDDQDSQAPEISQTMEPEPITISEPPPVEAPEGSRPLEEHGSGARADPMSKPSDE